MKLPRLSSKEFLILDLLSQAGELYGMGLVGRSQGQLKRGTVYVTLHRMEEKGLVRSRVEQIEEPRAGLPRRLYRPTDKGVALLRAIELAAMHLAAEDPA